jgi:hypothetical protein
MATKVKHGKATTKKSVARSASTGILLTTPVAVRFSEDDADLRQLLEARAQASDRSLSGQIKHYVRLAAIAEDNPDLPMSMIHGIIEAQAELKAGLGQPYRWGVIENE